MKTTLIMTLGMALAMCAGSLPAFADGPSIPVWSGAPIATPGDGNVMGHNSSVQVKHTDGSRTNQRG